MAIIIKIYNEDRPKIHDYNGAFRIELDYYFHRPQNHYGSRSKKPYKRDDAPIYHTNTPDIDNLTKTVKDAITDTELIWQDDSYVVEESCNKHWVCRYNQSEGVFIKIYNLEPEQECNDNLFGVQDQKVCKTPDWTQKDVDAIYMAYPKARRIGGSSAKKKIITAIGKLEKEHGANAAGHLLHLVKQYEQVTQGMDTKFIPHLTTWFNQERYDNPSSWRTFTIIPVKNLEDLRNKIQDGKITHKDGVEIGWFRTVTHNSNGVFLDGKVFTRIGTFRSVKWQGE